MDILAMSLTAGLLITAVTVVRAAALHRLPKALFPALWGLALFRLLIPFELPFRFNVYALIRPLAGNQNVLFPASLGGLSQVFTAEHALTAGNASPAEALSAMPTQPRGSFVSPVILVWLAVFAVMLCFFILSHIRSSRVLRQAFPVAPGMIPDAWTARLPGRPVGIYLSDRVTTALAAGLFRPRVYLPATSGQDQQTLRYVITHELEHIRHLDTLIESGGEELVGPFTSKEKLWRTSP